MGHYVIMSHKQTKGKYEQRTILHNLLCKETRKVYN